MRIETHSNKNVVFLLLLLLACSSCQTYNVYVVARKPVQTCSINSTQTIGKYQKLDSVFRVASKEAMRKALE